MKAGHGLLRETCSVPTQDQHLDCAAEGVLPSRSSNRLERAENVLRRVLRDAEAGVSDVRMCAAMHLHLVRVGSL